MNYTAPNSGASATAHVVTQVGIDFSGSNMLTATVSSFVDQDAYAAGKWPVWTQTIPIEGLPAAGQDIQAYAETRLIEAPPADAESPYGNRYVFANGTIAANTASTPTTTDTTATSA